MINRFGRALLATAWLSIAPSMTKAETKTKAAMTNSPAASWRTSAQGVTANGIRALSGADGVTAFVERAGSRALSLQAGATPPAQYFYFDVDDAHAAMLVDGPVYVEVEYFDEALGGSLQLEYDSATGEDTSAIYRQPESQAGGIRAGEKKWKPAIFVLRRPRFASRQNLGADFRLSGTVPLVRAIRVSNVRPANWAEVARMQFKNVKPLVKIGAKGQFIVGGFDTTVPSSNAEGQVNALEGAMPALKSLGVTSHEAYVVWGLCEPQPGRFDWSVYDRYVAIYKKYHIKWVPFLICGSAYSVPDWFYKKPGSQGYVCLEHGQESDVQSLWNPEMRRHVARFIQAFCERYRDQGVIETILLGVSGNYGEAIYVASGSDWTAGRHGDYHAHAGFWAGDPYAVKDFQGWLKNKYATPKRLNAAWGGTTLNFGTVRPFGRENAPNDRARLDFADWYIGAMSDYSRFWMRETRKHFRGDIQLCTGGHAPPEHGSDFGDQCKLAAEVGGGVRITNEASDYAANFSVTRWVASAGRQYGAHFSFEPAGHVSPEGVIARIYNATASGARGLHFYYPNLFEVPPATANFVRQGNQFQQRRPVVEVAVYYPQTYIKLHGNMDSSRFFAPAQRLRDRFDYSYMSDGQIRDGGLRKSKVLVLLEGNTAEAQTWSAIRDWVRSGGVLVYPNGMGRLRSVEGDESAHDALLGAGAGTGRGRVVTFEGDGTGAEYQDFLSRTLSGAPELSPGTRAMIAADGQANGVFATLCENGELLWYNSTAQEVRRDGMSSATTPTVLPPHSIVSQRLAPSAGGRP